MLANKDFSQLFLMCHISTSILVYLFGGNNYWLTFSVTLHSAPKYFNFFLNETFWHQNTYRDISISSQMDTIWIKNTGNKNKVDYVAL